MFKSQKILSAAAAALVLSFGAHAAPSAPPDAALSGQASGQASGPGAGPGAMQQPMHRPMHAGMQPGGAGLAHVLQRLHDQLKLTADQEKQWDQARQTTRQNFMAMDANHQDARKMMMQAAGQPILDLSGMLRDQEQFASRNLALRSDIEHTWVKFYDSLNDDQKSTVSTEIKRQWQRRMHGHGPHGPQGPQGPHGMGDEHK